MTLEQLRIYLEVARQEHVTRAAQELHLSQSAVSAAVSAMEGQYGVPLFDRVGRGIALNEAGRRFVPHAEAVLRRAAEAATWLSEVRDGEGGALRIQASQTVASYVLPRHIIRYQALYPRVELSFQQGNTASVVAAVVAGETDLGLVEGHVEPGELTVERVGGDRLVLLVGRGHPWQDGHPLSPRDLTRTEWVLREVGSGTRAVVDAEFARLRLEAGLLRLLLELPSNEACIAAVETGQCATVLSALAAAPHLAQGRILEAGFPFPSRSFSVLGHRERHRSRQANNFIALMRAPAAG